MYNYVSIRLFVPSSIPPSQCMTPPPPSPHQDG
jgi:hypothetical protein